MQIGKCCTDRKEFGFLGKRPLCFISLEMAVFNQCSCFFDDLHGMHVVALLCMCHLSFTRHYEEHVASVRHGRPG